GWAAFVGGLSAWGLLLLCVIVTVVLLAMARQGMEPLRNSDDWLYHATRVVHWIQNRSAFPYSAHVIQQNIVPFGSELFFLWPVLLTQSEWVGRLVFGLALPLAAVGQYLLLRTLRQGQTVALAGVLILVSTPLVLASAMGLKPEIWAILTLLGLAHWAVTVGSAPGATRCFFLGVFAVLSVNVRSFPVVLLPSLVLIVWWASGEVSRARRLKFLAAGGLCGALLSTLLIPLVFNTVNHGHPMGPEQVQRSVKTKIEPQVMYTHAVRFAFLTLELPDVPVSEEARAGFGRAANQAVAALGAGEPLQGEIASSLLGPFVYTLPEQAARYSLWGLLWMPVLLVALVHLTRNLVSTWPRVRLTDVSVLALLAIPLWAAILFGARWMVHANVPERFLVGAYTLALTLGISVLFPRLSGSRVARALAAMAVVYAAFQPVRALVQDVLQPAPGAAPGMVLDEPFSEVARSVLPPGSRVLLVGDKDSREYPLFAADAHYANTVIPWGIGGFDPIQMRRLMDTERVTHVLIHNDLQATFFWSPAHDTRPFVQWLEAEAGLRAIPLRSPRQRLYEVKGAVALNEAPFRLAEGPSGMPLVGIASALRDQVGLDPAMWLTPWPIQDPSGNQRGFLWLGQGYAEGLEFALWSRQDRDVDLRLDVAPGPGLPSPDRRLMLLHDDVPVGDVHAFRGAASVVVRTRLHAGRNLISLLALDIATVKPQPNGDPRNLVMGLNGIRVEPAQSGGADDLEHRRLDDALASSAQLAVGLIHRRQQADGYWFTSHTTGTRFDQPVQEMNTYLTALMVDLIGSGATPAVLAGSLERARHHLRSQIESNGLVRYHGKPGERAMRENGMCTITPDTDDTALVWRLAPGAESLRPAALETLRRYRADDGLYKTWLGRPDEYSCLNPGADPNPPDVGIQMHLLMWLAQVDPPAARSLCTALRNTIDQDRIWVYYRKAPLVPVMRQTDLRAVGCDLQLPPARVQTAIPEQQIWLNAAKMLVALEGGGDQVPAPAQVRQLLQALSANGFSAVRQNPPMLYHNDLSASVSRLYWSEDVGYALWLRLYLASAGRKS
ncbi:glycosyltransferase family 39 protein, partial [Hydrogenophaga sp. A37]|uniref:ArnT family glycosyltransferase n=1 Tax=Hydrogenophaga sp. A37 TaxID=1945864 RepID=UPI001C0B806E